MTEPWTIGKIVSLNNDSMTIARIPCSTCAKLRKALVDLVGVDGKETLEAMEVAIRTQPAPEQDKIVAINAIRVLLETL